MTDDVRDALVRFAKYCRKFSDDEARVYDHNADDIEAALAHIDGEPARTAAAVAAAREEQREACARHIREEFLADLDIDADSACLNAPIDATPLSDRLDELADDVLVWRLESAAVRAQLEQTEASALAWERSSAKCEAERDALRAQVADIHDALHRECDGKADLPREIRTLRAQVEAARAALLSLLPGDTHVNQHGVDWSLACGRRYLSVAGWVVAMEGDVSREVKSKARSWDGEEFKAIVEQFAEPIRKALAAMDKAKP